MAMFPLGSVLFPGMPLPLRIFEPRYVQLLDDVLAGDARFGVVLIERGSEVGGDDVRTDVGTVARVVSADEVADGLHAIVAAGEEVIEVVEWLTDDPYPRARVRRRGDRDATVDVDEVDRATVVFRRVVALVAEAGGRAVPATIELATDPVRRADQIAALSPLGPFDHQRILRAGDVADRLALTVELLGEHEELVRAGLTGRGRGPGD